MRRSEAAMTMAAPTDEALQLWRKYRQTWVGQKVEHARLFLQEIRAKADIQSHD
jgi:hypothetical protein